MAAHLFGRARHPERFQLGARLSECCADMSVYLSFAVFTVLSVCLEVGTGKKALTCVSNVQRRLNRACELRLSLGGEVCGLVEQQRNANGGVCVCFFFFPVKKGEFTLLL